jgi:CTP synthase (UTP-ammonia lyase)
MDAIEKLKKISKENHRLKKEIKTLKDRQSQFLDYVNSMEEFLHKAEHLRTEFMKTLEMSEFLVRWLNLQREQDVLAAKKNGLIQLQEEFADKIQLIEDYSQSSESYESSLQKFKKGSQKIKQSKDEFWMPYVAIYRHEVEVENREHKEALSKVESEIKASGTWRKVSKVDGKTILNAPDRKTIAKRIKKYRPNKV